MKFIDAYMLMKEGKKTYFGEENINYLFAIENDELVLYILDADLRSFKKCDLDIAVGGFKRIINSNNWHEYKDTILSKIIPFKNY